MIEKRVKIEGRTVAEHHLVLNFCWGVLMLGGTYLPLELEVSLICTKLPKNTTEHSASFFWFHCLPAFSITWPLCWKCHLLSPSGILLLPCRIFYCFSRIFKLSLDLPCHVPEYSVAYLLQSNLISLCQTFYLIFGHLILSYLIFLLFYAYFIWLIYWGNCHK